MSDDEPGEGLSPPYISFETFRNFLQRLDPDLLPPRIDRSMMTGMAGGTQTYLLQTLRNFGLINDVNEVRPELIEMLGTEERLAAGLRRILDAHYGPQMTLSRQAATAAQLSESFAPSGFTGSTLRKAVTFYLHAARAADVPLSPHFRAPAPRTVSPRSRRGSRTKSKPIEAPHTTTAPHGDAAESHTTSLKSGGTITLACSASFLSLSRSDRDFVFTLVDALKEYDASQVSDSGGPVSAGAGRD